MHPCPYFAYILESTYSFFLPTKHVHVIFSCSLKFFKYVNLSFYIIYFSFTVFLCFLNQHKKPWSWDNLTEQQVLDFKKAVKKFPVGTLQRWEKVANFLDCEVSEVLTILIMFNLLSVIFSVTVLSRMILKLIECKASYNICVVLVFH